MAMSICKLLTWNSVGERLSSRDLNANEVPTVLEMSSAPDLSDS